MRGQHRMIRDPFVK